MVNALSAVLQVLVSGILMFALYKILLTELGIETLGIWSLVMAATSVVNIGNLGLSNGVVKFVAQALAKGNSGEAASVIQTSFISLFAISLSAILIIYPLLLFFLETSVGTHYSEAVSIVPFALASLWLNICASVFQGGLDGCKRTDLRSIINIVVALLHFPFAVYLVKNNGLIGLAYAQVAQGLLFGLMMWVVLKHQIKALPILPIQWELNVFRRILKYGVSFQLSTLAIMLYEPVTKWMMGYFGGLTNAGYYEMASKMVAQLRSVLVSGMQVLVPIVASIHEKSKHKNATLYLKVFGINSLIAVQYYILIILSLPLISLIWVGPEASVFVLYSCILGVAAFFHTLVGPAYFSNLGSGRLKWNLVTHVCISVSNAIFGPAMGFMLGGFGVVLGSASALLLGSALLLWAYHRENRIAFAPRKSRENGLLLGASSTLLIIAYFLHDNYSELNVVLKHTLLSYFCFLIAVLPFAWRHPASRIIIGMLQKK